MTLSDVAEDAGVSPMTVSRVINDEKSVKATTRERVRESIKKLNYTPNLGARRLAGARVARICLLYANPSVAYLGELLEGALEAAEALGHQLIVSRTNQSVTPKFIVANMSANWDALIIPSPISDSSDIREQIVEAGYPAVFLSGAVNKARTDTLTVNEIQIDNAQAGYEMTQLLLQAGHRRIGFIKGDQRHIGSAQREVGYRRALQEQGVSVDENLILEGDFTFEAGADAGRALLGQKKPPTAIFASNDDMAAGVLAAAATLGLRVPDDLSVAGFDDSPIARTVWPNLTTIRQPVAEIGANAVRMLDTIMGSDSDDIRHKVLDFSVVKRGSVAPPRV